MEHPSHPVESHWRTSLRNRIIQASSLLEVLLSGLVLIGLLLSVVPLIRWMPGLLFDGNEAEPIRNITVNNFIVDEAPRPYYLFHTRDCRFNGCKVGGKKLPVTLPESESRQQCDVW